MTEEKKICPFPSNTPDSIPYCIGEACALYVKLVTPIILTDGKTSYQEPDKYRVFEGCGLIQQVPWETRQRK